jgi:hypothetical protein
MNKPIIAGFSVALFLGVACGGIPHGGGHGGSGGTGGPAGTGGTAGTSDAGGTAGSAGDAGAVCDRSDAYLPLACVCNGSTGWLGASSCPASLAEGVATVCAFYSNPLVTGYPTPPRGIPGLSGCGKVSVGIGIDPDGVFGTAAIFDETTGKLVGMRVYSDTIGFEGGLYGDTGFYGRQCDNVVPTCFPCADDGSWTACTAAPSE